MNADVVIICDPRFSGGTAAALISDAAAFSALGASVGILTVASGFFEGARDVANPQVLGLCDLPGVRRVTGPVTADVAFFHHPLAFFHGIGGAVPIRAARSVVVAHHPPFRGDGSLEYNPLTVGRGIHGAFGCRPWWAPVSGVVRAQLRSFSPLIAMTGADWVNTFDPAHWQPRREVFSGARACVGRHGRSDPLKWPARTDDILAPLSPGPAWHTRVMGCPPEVAARLGPAAERWDILDFNAEPVTAFIESLDVFALYSHPRWVEAFGRTVIEAVLMRRLCVLEPRLERNFGDLADYCPPSEAPAVLESLRRDPQGARRLAERRARDAIARFGVAHVGPRLDALRADPGTRSRRGAKSATPAVAVRKVLGLARRRARGTGVRA